jgi:hypothetical protein
MSIDVIACKDRHSLAAFRDVVNFRLPLRRADRKSANRSRLEVTRAMSE